MAHTISSQPRYDHFDTSPDEFHFWQPGIKPRLPRPRRPFLSAEFIMPHFRRFCKGKAVFRGRDAAHTGIGKTD